MGDRERFLADVDRELPFGDRERDQILEELDGHIEDSVRVLADDGVSTAAALHVALQRLGPAATLGHELGVARRSPRRLLAAAGGPLGRIAVAAAIPVGALGSLLAVAAGTGAGMASGASSLEEGMNPMQGVSAVLADPNLVFVLFVVGFYGLLFELLHPNFMTGVVGGLALLLAVIGSGNLPVNVGAVALLGLAVVLLFVEPHAPSHGLLAIAGVVCFVLGAVTFYASPGPGQASAEVAWPVVAGSGGVGVALSLIVLRAALNARRLKPATVSPGLGYSGVGTVGAIGEVHRTLEPDGIVRVAGEAWSARALGPTTTIPLGASVRVVRQNGLVLVVEPEVEARLAAPARP